MQPTRILVIDDTVVNLKLMAALLESKGYEVALAASGLEGLEKVKAQQPDLILLDVMMPEISGYEVCRRLREQPETSLLPIIMVTSLDETERVKGLEVGADDFLTKPINQAELFARVKSLLRIKHLQQQIIEQNQQLSDLNASLSQQVAAQVQQIEKMSSLQRFLPDQVANKVMQDGDESIFKPHRKEVSVVFIDIRGFTSMVDSTEPEEVMEVLSAYHDRMGRLIVKHNGTLERFAGDGIMIFFNDPISLPEHSSVAVQLAIEMQQAFSDLQSQWKKMGLQLGFGVGIARGYATLGMIGFEGRRDYAAIGSVTNASARLCEQAKDGEILMDLKTFARMSQQDKTEKIGDMTLKGFIRPFEVYKIDRKSLLADNPP